MAIDVAALAATVVSSFLVPYARKGLDRIRGEVTESAGEAVVSGVEKVWSKVKSLFTSDRDRMRLEDLAEYPPEVAAPIVTSVLEAKLREDPQAAEELAQLVEAPVPAAGGMTLSNFMAEHVIMADFRHARIGGRAQAAGQIINQAAPPREPSPPASPGAGN
jgi:hypothetical protein